MHANGDLQTSLDTDILHHAGADMFRTIRTAAKSYSHDPKLRGYHAVYRETEKNFCPGCGRSHWWLGRFSAECGYCGTALPLTEALFSGSPLHVHVRRGSKGGAVAEFE
jgi:hypothetical protein